jgi:hypothetical protein
MQSKPALSREQAGDSGTGFIDNRQSATQLRQLAALTDNSPRVAAQRAAANRMNRTTQQHAVPQAAAQTSAGSQPAIHGSENLASAGRDALQFQADLSQPPFAAHEPGQGGSPLTPSGKGTIQRAVDPAALENQLQESDNAAGSEGDAELAKIDRKFSDHEEQHRLFVAKQEGDYALMVASSPQLLKTYVQTKKTEVKGTGNEDGFKEIETLIERYNDVSSGYKVKLGKRLQELMQAAVAEMRRVNGDDEELNKFDRIPPQTKVAWGGTVTKENTNLGTSMDANPLSIDPGGLAGSEPSSQYKKTYVKGHLLNHHLHGPAVEENLTPMTASMNTTFEKKIESFLKQKIISENKVFRFKVDARNFGAFAPGNITIDAQELKPKQDDPTQWEDDDDGWRVQGDLDQGGNCTAAPTRDGEEATPARSDPALLEDFLKQNNPLATADLTSLNTEFKAIQHEWSIEFGVYLRDVMSKVVQELQKLFPATRAMFPKSHIEYGPTKKFKNSDLPGYRFSDEHGTRMDAKLLSINPGNNAGYEPQTERWGNLVQGHLLNHHLHGPAESKNLLPMSNSLNTDMEKKIESAAKKMVLEENKVVRYQVWAGDEIELDESNILLGKDASNIEEEDEIPSTPNAAITEYEDAQDIFDESSSGKDSQEIEEAEKDLEEKEEGLQTAYRKEERIYNGLPDYSIQSTLHAKLQPLKLKRSVDPTNEDAIDDPKNWEPGENGLSYTGKNGNKEEKAAGKVKEIKLPKKHAPIKNASKKKEKTQGEKRKKGESEEKEKSEKATKKTYKKRKVKPATEEKAKFEKKADEKQEEKIPVREKTKSKKEKTLNK